MADRVRFTPATHRHDRQDHVPAMRKMILDRTQKFWAVWIVLFGLGAIIFFVVGHYPTGFLMAVTAALGEWKRRIKRAER